MLRRNKVCTVRAMMIMILIRVWWLNILLVNGSKIQSSV